MAELVVGVTGASGAVCARALIRGILTVTAVRRIHVVVSRFASQSVRLELGVAEKGEDGIDRGSCESRTSCLHIASGSSKRCTPLPKSGSKHGSWRPPSETAGGRFHRPRESARFGTGDSTSPIGTCRSPISTPG